ncbi:hypothetical protein CJP72_12190 [Citrobacter sp. NCU1]|uniref:hypothetical protein n=1 Tax=Citrobacter sp. NCU1 TaxID=2026683 RepID=UPI001390E515|nr:hypothetical protein [Citrobacter sp. NCU1]NDO81497.1 hypothetical protein [Citrobacter sp. NCU1]
MSYEIYFAYKSGATSHNLQTDSRRVIDARLRELLTNETETRQMADRIVMKRAGAIILDMPTSASNKEIISSVLYPRVGAPSKIENPVSLSCYIPGKAADFLKKRGDGSASKGLRLILIEVGGEEMRQAYQPKK